MSRLTDWIRRNQLAAFFILTFSITWGLGFSYGGVLLRGQFLLFPLVAIATCGPALAGIIITALTNTEPKQGTNRAFWSAFFVAWVLSALVFLTHITLLNIIPFSLEAVGFGLVSVMPVAFVISMACSRIPAVKRYLSSLIRLREVWGWALVGLVLIPGLVPLSLVISSLLGRQSISDLRFPESGLTLIGLVAVRFLYQIFFFNATGEEVGWRGFALPRLQARTSPLIAALIIALFWAPWHFFLWQAEGSPVLTWQYWLERYVGTILPSVFIVWICNRAQGSILVAGITHAAVNTAEAFIPIEDGQILYLTCLVAALVMILADRMWKKLPPEHPAVYRLP
jgi:membrane protease YdiL (CAAX protease family)